jgi:GNAT superfamily N-acetyltransferase
LVRHQTSLLENNTAMPSLDQDALLAIYDDDQRRRLTYPLIRREVTPQVIRHVDSNGLANFVLYSSLTAATADAVIQGEIAYFSGLGQSFEWKLYAHDQPADLQARLAAHGFTIGEEEAIVVLPLAEALTALYDLGGHDVRCLTDPDHLEDVLLVESAVWGADDTDHIRHLADELRAAPNSLSIYVGYVDGHPASCGWVRFAPGSTFAGLWAGSTILQYRGRGLYRALVAARAREARARGVGFLNVDASAMSRPILERLGFQCITRSWPCRYEPSGEG